MDIPTTHEQREQHLEKVFYLMQDTATEDDLYPIWEEHIQPLEKEAHKGNYAFLLQHVDTLKGYYREQAAHLRYKWSLIEQANWEPTSND